MKLEKCLSCESLLVSGAEQRHHLCMAHLEVKIAKQMEMEVEVHDLKVAVDRLKRDKEDSDQNVAKVQKLLKAETEGIMAADRGISETDNPYPDGDECCAMWLNGWQSVETRRITSQAIAVIRWSTQSLDTIQELARGYGQQEISDKIDVIRQKLEQFSSTGG